MRRLAAIERFSRVALVLAVISALGIPLALTAGRHRPSAPTTVDYAAAAASGSHTLSTATSS